MTITLEEALELMKLPRILGTFEEKEVRANIGRFRYLSSKVVVL